MYSFNHRDEIPLLKSYKGVNFIEAKHTMTHIFGKHYACITEMIDFAKNKGDHHFCLINSDIELDMSKVKLQKIRFQLVNGICILNRWDYVKNKKHSNRYLPGIDAFFLHKKHLHIYPPSLFCMGQCFWDYNIPFTAIKNNIPVYNIQNKFAYHKKHPVQYSQKNWEIMGKHFILEHNLLHRDIPRMSELVYNFLDLNQIKITI